MKDTEVQSIIKKEERRQEETIDLIASENYASDDVREALASVFVNKYAEGYPGARYYRGNKYSDEIESLCRERALELYKLSTSDWAVNVQPLSGSPANFAAYIAAVPLGGSPSREATAERGKIMGMSLAMGGHLTHGQPVSVTGKIWQQVPYGVSRETEMLDYDEVREIAERERPALIVAGYTAYPRIVDWAKFRAIADSCEALLMVDMSHFAGLVAGDAYPSPFAYADIVTTTTHKTLRGPRSAMIFSRGDVMAKKIDTAIIPGLQGGPHLNQIAAVAVALKEAMAPSFKEYTAQIVKNAQALATALAECGWRIVTGGTDTHLLLVDTWADGKGIGGKDAAVKLEEAGIIVNQNTIPFDTRKPMDPSGIRLGTPAVTTRGMKEADMVKLAERIDKVLKKS